jgi:hypothetical protein
LENGYSKDHTWFGLGDWSSLLSYHWPNISGKLILITFSGADVLNATWLKKVEVTNR